MNRILLSSLVALVPLLSGLAGTFAATPSEKAVVEKLRERKIKVGYDKDRQHLVFIGTTSREMANPAADRGFQLKRRRAYAVAELKARHALMDYVEKDVSASERVSAYLVGADAGVRTESRFTTVSSMELIACVPIYAAESYADGRYGVSVAVGWSERAEKLARQALKRKGFGDTAKDELDSWLKKFDFSTLLGSRQFIDSNGALYQIGISASNIEGMRGFVLKNAMRKADLLAVRELAHSLCVPMCGVKEISAIYDRVSTLERDEEAIASDFTSSVEGRISNLRLPGVFRVYDTTVRHPISGQLTYVSVYGLMINDEVVKESH